MFRSLHSMHFNFVLIERIVKMKLFPSSILVISLFCAAVSADAAVLKLSVRDAIDMVLQSGNDRKLIDYGYLRSEYPLYQALGVYDPAFTSSYTYEKNRLESLSGIANPEDKNTIWKAGLAKKFSTGTLLSVEYSRFKQESVLNSFLAGLRPSTQAMDQVDFVLRQNILGNFFGILDRGAVDIAERMVQKAELDKYEVMEDLVLQTIRAYWRAFATKESLQDTMLGREKYRQLVAALKRKFGRGIDDDRAELPKAEAELANQERSVKIASLNYLNAVDTLVTLMNVPPAEDIEFVVPLRVPPPPAVEDDKLLIAGLRKVKAAQLGLASAAQSKRAAELGNFPTINLIGQASFNGVERTENKSFADMSNGNHPRYLVGVEMNYRFGSDAARGEKALKGVQFMESEVALDKAKIEGWQILETTARNVKAKYLIATTAEDTLAGWERAIRQQEKNYRVGRISTAELIQDYNAYFFAQSARSNALSDYHVAIQEYAAARDRILER